MTTRFAVLPIGVAALICGATACTSTPESTLSSAPGSGAATEGSTYGTDARSLSVGGAGMGGADNGGGTRTSAICSH